MSIRIGNEYLNIPGLSSARSKTASVGSKTISRAGSSTKSNNVSASFASELSSSIAALSATGSSSLSALNPYANISSSLLYNNLNSLYSGLSYNNLNTSSLLQNYWGRNDFPLEALYGSSNASSILSWLPQSTEPASNAVSVLSRLNPTLGMKAIVISPELESRVNSNSQLMQDVMDKISSYISGTDEMFSGQNKSDALIFDENGNISHYRTFTEDKGLVSTAETKPVADKANSRIRVVNYPSNYFSKI